MSANRLAGEASPYLLQHAENPVDWYPWCDAAFERARQGNMLILLSIGYSTCHWCHVMAHECFEDNDVAALMNRNFVSIKVDREERPDIDQVYMEACQRMTGGGGWPLTVFLTPSALPFYAATYIPKRGSRGRPGMMELLPLVAEKWQTEPEQLVKVGQQVVDLLNRSEGAAAAPDLDAGIFAQATEQLGAGFDTRHAGFGKAPKFPRPHDLSFLLQRYRATGDASLLAMVEQTLVAMRCGGIYDHLGFGFHRYATDAAWQVPHFEKMLYDQAGLLTVYAEAFQLTGNPMYARTAREIVTYLRRDLRATQGAFYSAEDADTEGVEGLFYVWSAAEIRQHLGNGPAQRFSAVYGVVAEGNFHDEASGELTGANILSLSTSAALDDAERLAEARHQLLSVRQKRIRPHRDEKLVTGWNGMLISALAKASTILDEPSFYTDAKQVARCIEVQLTTSDGRLLRCSRDGTASVGGFAEDYAFVACGLLDLYAAGFETRYLLRAIDLAERLVALFQDEQSGCLYDTAHDANPLVVRPRTGWDGAIPSAGSVALDVFARLFLLTADLRWRTRAERLLLSFSAQAARSPGGFTRLLQAASWLLEPSRELVVAGRQEASETHALLKVAQQHMNSNIVILLRPEPLPAELAVAAPFLEAMTTAGGKAQAYLCQDFTCRQPCRDPESLQQLLTAPLED